MSAIAQRRLTEPESLAAERAPVERQRGFAAGAMQDSGGVAEPTPPGRA